ncbi:MAG: endonuclease III [Candidatus Bathyarchaeota archaeon]|nr:endonuclease III [Candidatus Bathyarchaeota archaeon]
MQESSKTVDINRDNKTEILKIIELLEKEHPDSKIALNHSNPLELLVATILSAQCTDKRVNIVTKTLFKKHRKAEEYANAGLDELEKDIRSTGFYRNKARNIKKCCQILVERFNSQVPRTMEKMLELPGVARKTANVVLSNAFGIIVGIAVDTHVRRLVRRLGLSEHENPNKVEKDLMELVPKTYWKRITDLLIFHGRRICLARKPKCDACVLNNLCPSAFTFN